MPEQENARRVVVITGAASGIGANTARTIAAPGTDLLLHTRKNAASLDAVAQTCREHGSRVAIFLGDLADPATAPALIEKARGELGAIDQIVSNAGQAFRSDFSSLSPDDVAASFASMPLAFLRLVSASLADLRASACGRVVVISSFVAHIFGTAGLLFPGTSAAKAALEALAKALAVELAPHGVTVNIVVPGFTRKEGGGHLAASSESLKTAVQVTPTGRLTEPADIAATVAFLLSAGAAQITGQAIHVNGGLTLA
ncbi:MAG TPA: SDR family oxidoreductase [Bauldia sp.]|nr:SDR family oxidoreductase [Bauldia sp.]